MPKSLELSFIGCDKDGVELYGVKREEVSETKEDESLLIEAWSLIVSLALIAMTMLH